VLAGAVGALLSIMDLTTVHEGGQSGWFALTCGLSSELSSLLSDGKHDVEIMWTSERKGVILVDGKAAFDVVLSESKVVEPYRLDQQNKELSYFGPVLGRCSTMSLGQSTAGGPNLNATAAAAAAATATAAAASAASSPSSAPPSLLARPEPAAPPPRHRHSPCSIRSG
jgi:hypothetical protein